VTGLPKRFPFWKTRVVLIFDGVVVAVVCAALGGTFGLPGVVLGGLIPLAWVVLFAGRVGIDATADGLVVRGALSLRRIRWSEVDHVEMEESLPWSAWIVLVDGSRVRSPRYSPLVFQRTGKNERRRMVRELNEIRAAVVQA